MPFKKGISGNPIGRPKGSLSTTSKLIREYISQAIDGNKIMEMLDKIDSPTEYINAISKLLKLKIIESYKIELLMWALKCFAWSSSWGIVYGI